MRRRRYHNTSVLHLKIKTPVLEIQGVEIVKGPGGPRVPEGPEGTRGPEGSRKRIFCLRGPLGFEPLFLSYSTRFLHDIMIPVKTLKFKKTKIMLNTNH